MYTYPLQVYTSTCTCTLTFNRIYTFIIQTSNSLFWYCEFSECNPIFQDHLTVIFMSFVLIICTVNSKWSYFSCCNDNLISYHYNNSYNTHVAATLAVWDLLEWILLVAVYTLSITVPIPSPGLVHQGRLQIRVTGTRIVCNQTMYNIQYLYLRFVKRWLLVWILCLHLVMISVLL